MSSQNTQSFEDIIKTIANEWPNYRPANTCAQQGTDGKSFSKETLDRFEELFKTINGLFASENAERKVA